MKNASRLCPAVVAAGLCLAVGAPLQAGTANIVLQERMMTSAGVFDGEDRLIRTLWSGRRQPAGNVAIEWDGFDDDGMAVPRSGTYTARILVHDVRYVWEGVIGNTSDDATGARVYRALGPINDMAIDSHGTAFHVVGYNEQQTAIHRFDVIEPQRRIPLAHDDYRRAFRYAATDGNLVYLANVGVVGPPGSRLHEATTFVIALQASDGAEHRFPAGLAEAHGTPANRWESAIDRDRVDTVREGTFLNAPSGLAVQQRGNVLFVAHRHLGEIRLLDKRAGHQVDRIAIDHPADMDVAPDDSLWVLCRIDGRQAAARYRLRDGRWTRAGQVMEGLIDPVAIGVSPVDGTVVVADAGTGQLKAFDDAGKPLWTLGRAGTYRDGNPEVALDTFWFSAGPTYIAFQADGSFWFGDPGNVRNLHFSADLQYRQQIMYLPKSYVSTVDPGAPTRVFRHFLEFAVDYSRPLRDSWTLVRNWAAGLDERYAGGRDGLRAVFTLENGRTYGVVHRFDLRQNEVVELTTNGLRPTGARLETGTKMYPDGSLRSHVIRFGSLGVYQRRLAGFDAEGNPQWDPPALLGDVSGMTERDPAYRDVPLVSGVNEATYPQTESGLIVAFDPGRAEGFHLGGIRPGSHRWQWRASPSGTWEVDRNGDILSRSGIYQLGNGVHYPGNVVMAAGRHIIYGYHGEGWNGGQANQWLHYFDNGLFIGQFGRPVYAAGNRTIAQPESAGNAFSPSLVAVNGQLYLWHNDEAVHGGVHRWRIDGADDIRIVTVPIHP